MPAVFYTVQANWMEDASSSLAESTIFYRVDFIWVMIED
jgi:hypothetical protein